MIHKFFILAFFFFFFSDSMCLKLWIVSGKLRTIEESKDNKSFQKTRSYLKAKQWLEYKLNPETSKIEKEVEAEGRIEGIGLIRCYVPYGVGEVDANEHEFQYTITIRDGSATFLVYDIFSYIKDPNDIILNYGPKVERVAKVTIRSCFKPLIDDFFEYIK
jgi:hypothetical protein